VKTSIRVLAGVLTLAGCCATSYSQSAPQSCGIGDRACLEAQYARACTTRTSSTLESCSSWIRSVEAQSREDDRATRLLVATAYVKLGTFFTDDPDIRARSLAAAQSICRRFASIDSSDADAMTGLATLTSDSAERLQLLRRIDQLKPHPITLNALTQQLIKSGRLQDLLEAAESNERAYSIQEGAGKWPLAAASIALYQRADAGNRAEELRKRVTRDLGPDLMLADLSKAQTLDEQKILSTLRILCDPAVAEAASAQYCLEAMDVTLPSLLVPSDVSSARRIAQGAAAYFANAVQAAPESFVEADPRWRSRTGAWFDQVESNGLGSSGTHFARASIEVNKQRRIDSLEKALSYEPENANVLNVLAVEYMEQHRWDGAILLLQRAKASPSAKAAEHQQLLDRNIESAIRQRDASRAAQAPR
jgi:hypothetical protein